MEKIFENIKYLRVQNSLSCTKKCHYCYNKILKQKSPRDSHKLLISLDKILEKSKHNIKIELIGGEPLDTNTIDDTINTLCLIRNKTHVSQVILSTSIDDVKKVKRALPFLDLLYLSVDISSSRQNYKPFNKENIEGVFLQCKLNSSELNLSVVLHGDESLSDIDDLICFSIELGINRIGISHISHQSHNATHLTKYNELYYYLYKCKLAFRTEIDISGTILENIDAQLVGATRSGNCTCGDSNFTLTPDGGIIQSICLPYSSINHDNSTFLNMKQIREEKLENGVCKNCSLWGVCKGGCSGSAFKIHNNYLNHDSVNCYILKRIWKNICRDLENFKI